MAARLFQLLPKTGVGRVALAGAGVLVIGLGGLFAWTVWGSGHAGEESQGPPNVAVRQVADVAARPTKVVQFADGCMTAECHTGLAHSSGRGGIAHATTCSLCHEADTGGHVFPVVKNVGQACTACHPMHAAVEHAHDRRTEMNCTNCHATHAGHGAKMLKADTLARTCEQCHPAGHSVASLHSGSVNGRCDMCHDMHGSRVRNELRTGTEGESCTGCHDVRLETGVLSARAHANLAEGCIACHREHGGMSAGRLKRQPSDLCLSCHEDVRASIAREPTSPDAQIMLESCTRCHEPHNASLPAMMKKPERDLCMECHAKAVVRADGSSVRPANQVSGVEHLHGPVAQGRCGACHTGHGGRHTERTNLASNQTPIGPFDLKNYDQCFACHDRGLVLDEGERATAFRHGTRNLHKLHVQAGERSRGCGSCHSAHGSNQPRLIAETVAFEGSEWNMKMGYNMTPGGGSCSPGCHAPMNYLREPQGGVIAPPGGLR